MGTRTIFHPAKQKSNICHVLGLDLVCERGQAMLATVRDTVKEVARVGKRFVLDRAPDVEDVMEYRLDREWSEELKDVQPLAWMGY